jgi:hypothetical protein
MIAILGVKLFDFNDWFELGAYQFDFGSGVGLRLGRTISRSKPFLYIPDQLSRELGVASSQPAETANGN